MNNYVITGASSGIGAATKALLEQCGHKVFNIDLRGGDCNADLSSPAGRQAAIDAVHAAFPDGIDGLVCCAGVPGSCGNLKLMMSLNYYGAAAIAEGCFDLLKMKHGSCVLLSTNSIAEGFVIKDLVKAAIQENSEETLLGIVGGMDQSDLGLGSAVYMTAKYALTLWMRRHAMKWGVNRVRINCIAPGTTNTPMVAGMNDEAKYALNALAIPLKYHESLFLEPEEIANVITFLLSDKSTAIHGAFLIADGGTDVVLNTDHIYE